MKPFLAGPNNKDALIELVKTASSSAASVFRKTGEFLPLWHLVKANGEQMVLQPPAADKDAVAALMTVAFEILDIVRYVFVAEAWIITSDKKEGQPLADYLKTHDQSIHEHPQRSEALIFSAEARDGFQIMGRRAIIRSGAGKPKLGPLLIGEVKFRSNRIAGGATPVTVIVDRVNAAGASRQSARCRALRWPLIFGE